MDTEAFLEREADMATVERQLERAREGTGRMVAIEGAAGLGKSRLLTEAGRLGSKRGFTLLTARGEELSRGFPWGLARRLLRGALTRARSNGEELLEGAASTAALLFDRSAPALVGSQAEAVLAVAYALVWAISDLAEAGPLLLSIDDAQWADEVSLFFLGYLLGRLDELPVTVLLAHRRREPGVESLHLETIVTDPRVERIALGPLSPAAVDVLVQDALGASTGDLSARCAAMTNGNPFYLRELLLELARIPAEALGPEALERLAPESVTRSVLVRLVRLGSAAVAFARAVAVLGDGPTMPQAAELAGLDKAEASRAFDALAQAEIFRAAEPLGFVHPLVARAIHADIGPGERGGLHRAAADLLAGEGAGPEVLAAHLAQSARQGDPWVVSTLRAAADRAVAQGASGAAADWLSRALDEPAPKEERGQLLVELGRAEATLGRAAAPERLAEAADLVEDRDQAALVCRELGRALLVQGRPEEAAAAFERGVQGLDDPGAELHKELRADWWSAASLMEGLRDEARRAPAPPLPADGERPTPGERGLLAQLAMKRAFEGDAKDEVAALAIRAWGDGELLGSATGDGVTWSLVTGALLVADEVELGLEVCDAVLADARLRGSPMAFANASYCRAWPLFARGRISDSVADSQTALEARKDGWSAFVGTGTAMLVMGLVERGELREAEGALALVRDDESLRASTQYPLILIAEGRLLAAAGRPDEALDELLRAGELLGAAGFECPSAIPWRADAALAAGLMGNRSQARELAESALSAARKGGAPTAIARALRAAARAERGEHAIDLHRKAVAALDGLPPRLERTHALVDLGAALRRGRRRADARELLRTGHIDAERGERWPSPRPLESSWRPRVLDPHGIPTPGSHP